MSSDLRKSGIRIVIALFVIALISIILFMLSGYFVARKPITFLPEIQKNDTSHFPSYNNQIKLTSPWYVLKADEYGKVVIETHKGEAIMSDLKYYSEYEGNGTKWDLNNVSVNLSNDSTISILGEGALNTLVNMSLTVHTKLPKLDVDIRTRYGTNTIVHRETLVAAFDVPVSEVYRKNRQVDVKSFDTEYWLERQGVRFGKRLRSALIYNTPFVSSLQLNSERNLLFINLEYSLDHPYVHFPFQADSGGRWDDCSAANYLPGAERKNNFSIYLGGFPQVTPRIMLVPDGYLAGYIFTEHADGGNLQRNQAVYLGSEGISDIDSAIGGFVGHRIPVTKSVFYVYPPGSSVRDDPQFLDFLDQLDETGLYDICLHTPDDLNSNRELLEESIKFMKERFDAITWIDHGFYNGKINRESFVCDGLNPESRYYAADLWEKYETRYFWSPAAELIHEVFLKKLFRQLRFKDASAEIWSRYLSRKELKEIPFYSAAFQLLRRSSSKYELNSLKPFKGEAYPTPLYWQNRTQANTFYSWVTDYVKDYSDLSTNKANHQFVLEQRLLDKLIADWGVFVNHGYFVRNRTSHDNGIWTEQNGKILVNPYFDKLLEKMDSLRNDGNLYVTTIREFLDYLILAENITFEYMPDGRIYVNNNNKQPVKGLSLVVCADSVLINNEIPKFKRFGENTIFWFDIPAGDRVKLQIKPR